MPLGNGLLTPFDEAMNRSVVTLFAAGGIGAVLPSGAFSSIDEAGALDPEGVYTFAHDAFGAAPDVDGICFQGARLDPVPLLDRLERDLGTPVVASNPAMLWQLLGRLGHRHRLEHGGRLLREWPAEDA